MTQYSRVFKSSRTKSQTDTPTKREAPTTLGEVADEWRSSSPTRPERALDRKVVQAIDQAIDAPRLAKGTQNNCTVIQHVPVAPSVPPKPLRSLPLMATGTLRPDRAALRTELGIRDLCLTYYMLGAQIAYMLGAQAGTGFLPSQVQTPNVKSMLEEDFRRPHNRSLLEEDFRKEWGDRSPTMRFEPLYSEKVKP